MAFPKLYRENIGAVAVGAFAADTGAEGAATAYSDAPDNYGSLVRPAPAAAYLSLRYGTGTFSRTYSGFKPNGTVRGFFHFYHDNAGLNGQSVQVSNSTSGNSATVTPLAGIAIIQPLVCQANGSGSVTFTIAAGSSYWLLNCFELFDVNITRQIVCEGDSRVDSYGVGSLDTFPAKLAALLGANYYRAEIELIYSPTNKINVINIGTGNSTSADALGEIPTQIDPLYNSGIRNDVVLHTGGNDEGHGLTQTQTLTNYHSYKSNVEGKGWTFYGCTVSDGNTTPGLRAKMIALSADIRSTVPLNRVIDLALSAQLNDYANLTYFQSDGIHYAAAGNQIQAQIAAHILSPPPLLLPLAGCQLYLQPEMQAGDYSSGQDVTFLTDYSVYARNVAVPDNYPVYSSPALNGKAVVVWDGTKKPLKTTAAFTVACGFMVVKVNEDTFSNYSGILTDTQYLPILVGDSGTNHFYDSGQTDLLFEYRMSDRITSRNLKTGIFTPPAPMNEYRIIFFRYWKPVQVSGIQIGQDRTDTARKAKMSLALLALYSTGFCESDIRKSLEDLAEYFGMTLEDVFPFYLDQDSTHRDVQGGNADYPASGGIIAETLGEMRTESELNFANRRKTEIDAMRSYLVNHYLQSSFLVRSFATIPPRDLDGYATSLLEFPERGTSGAFSFLSSPAAPNLID